jgi:hypothetical protein
MLAQTLPPLLRFVRFSPDHPRADTQTDCLQKYATNQPGVFAAGDCRRGQSLIVWGIKYALRVMIAEQDAHRSTLQRGPRCCGGGRRLSQPRQHPPPDRRWHRHPGTKSILVGVFTRLLTGIIDSDSFQKSPKFPKELPRAFSLPMESTA